MSGHNTTTPLYAGRPLCRAVTFSHTSDTAPKARQPTRSLGDRQVRPPQRPLAPAPESPAGAPGLLTFSVSRSFTVGKGVLVDILIRLCRSHWLLATAKQNTPSPNKSRPPPPRTLVTLLRDSGYEGPPSKGRGGGAAYFHRRHPTSELYSSLAMEQRLPRGVLRAHPTASLGAQRAERGRAGGSLPSAAG